MSDDTWQRRYARHIAIPSIGKAGQQLLQRSHVVVIGVGGLGSPVLLYLVASGIGQLTIADYDTVNLSNLQRQILFETGDINRLKTESARDALHDLNPDISFTLFSEKINTTNIKSLIKDADIIADCTDNFETRRIIHQACHDVKKPLVSAAAIGLEGMISTYKAYLGKKHPCYECCLPPSSDTRAIRCEDHGILGSITGIMGSIQATEIIKELLGIGESLSGYLLRYQALESNFKKSKLTKNPDCEICA